MFDDTTQRDTLPPLGKVPYIDWMQWGADDSIIYGTQYTTIDEGGITTINVAPTSVSIGQTNGSSLHPTITQFVPATGLLYSYGGAYDPVKLSLTGSFSLPETGAETCTADPVLNRYFCIVTYSLGGTDITNYELWVFDLSSNALLSRTLFGNTSEYSSNSTVTGFPVKLVRWGSSGLAVVTKTGVGHGNGGLFLLDGSAINANAPADTTAGTALAEYPAMKTISPSATTPNAGQVQVTIEGTGFTSNTSACWNCSSLQLQLLPSTYISPTEIQAIIPVAALSANAPLAISVFDQSSMLFSQNALSFTIASSSGTTQVTPLNICGLSVAWDANSQLLYVGTADYDGAYPNSIVAVDPVAGTVATSSPVGPDPEFLADSAGGQFLYVAYAGSTNLTQLSLPGLSVTATGVLDGWQGGPWFPLDLKAAPVNPHTTALTLFNPPAFGGIDIFDDGIQRPNLTPDFVGPGSAEPYFDTVAWSSSDLLLTSAQNQFDSGPLFSINLNDAGVTTATQGAATFNTLGAQIHSDFGTDYIYSDNGNVADPTNGAIVSSYQASGLVAPDSSLNRTFILGQISSQTNSTDYTIQSFDEKAFTPVASITLKKLSGIPFELVRWGKTGLAVLTTGGNGSFVDSYGTLYLIDDSTFVSSAPSANALKPAKEERVQQRWKRLSKTEMLETARLAARRAPF